ncbi:MAG: hypothetical protein IKY54_05510, partial [Muribaculaceae bacterium]|nr:hypothetical protein [Muribaculaceae bacterium]
WFVVTSGVCYLLKANIVEQSIFDILLYPLVIILISNTVSIYFAYLLGIFYMKKYTNFNLSKEMSYYMSILFWFVVTSGVCYLLKANIVEQSIFDILLYPLVIILILITFTKFGMLLNRVDLERYLGLMPKIKNVASKILFR